MSLNLYTATARITREMAEAETAIAEALVATTALLHSAALAQRDVAGAPVAHAQGALAQLAKMTTGLLEIVGNARRAHGHLVKVGVETGAMEEPTCPEEVFTTGSLEISVAA